MRLPVEGGVEQHPVKLRGGSRGYAMYSFASAVLLPAAGRC